MTLWDLDARMARTLERVRADTGVSLAFGGPVGNRGTLTLQRFVGPTVGALPGTTLDPEHGLGGRTIELRRPITLDDYCESRVITHQYDVLIRAERLRAMVSAPVIIGKRPVAVLYGSFRGTERIGDRIQQALMDEARCLEQELLTAGERGQPAEDEATELRARGRHTYRELRRLANELDDPHLRETLRELARGLTSSPQTTEDQPTVALTARETDVLVLASTGASNPQIAELLGLRLYTVKDYLKTATHKLGATGRFDAVTRARAAGIIA